jgi:hypothetical protein
MNAVTTALARGVITPGEAAAVAGVYETFVRTAGIARESAQGRLLQILAAGDDVEDEDEDIGDAEAIDDRDRRRRRRLPAKQFVEGSLFNLEEKSSCRFSADAGSGIALSNLWLRPRLARRPGALSWDFRAATSLTRLLRSRAFPPMR